MDNYAKLAENLKRINGGARKVPLFTAKVVSLEGESCTVDIDGLELNEVRLKATINEASNFVVITPKVGSLVLIFSLSGDLKDLAIVKVDEIEKIEYKQDGLELELDSVSKKVALKNEQVSLTGLFSSLSDLLKQFKVQTPSGVSTVVTPDTLKAILQFEMDFKQLLK